MKTNKPAGFWLRLLSRLIDLMIVITIISFSLYFSVSKHNGDFYFHQDFLYYFWTAIAAVTMLMFTVLIPLATKGRSIGNLITRTKIKSKNMSRAIIHRELFFGLSWTAILVIFMVVLNQRIFLQVINRDIAKPTAINNSDLFRIGFVNTFAGIIIFGQFILAISILVKKKNNSIIDNFSKSKVVRTRKFIEEEKEEKKKKINIQPKTVKNNSVEWIKGE